MRIFTLGGTGMLGSRVVELLQDKYKFDDLSRSNGVDITNPLSLGVIRNDKEHEVVILFSAKADVDLCEADKDFGEEGEAYKVNVIGAKNVADVCRNSAKKLIFISTDFVFDGDNPPGGGYKEEDSPNPINWYAETKYRGEKEVKNSGAKYLILRPSYPYRKEFEKKNDFMRAIRDRLKDGKPIAAVTDQIICPTFIDDIATCIHVLIHHNKEGIYHITGSQNLSPYDASNLIAEKFGLDKDLISKTTATEYFMGKARRPLNAVMNNDKIKNLGVKMRSFEEGLDETR